jgi:hypothetical protein
MQFRALVFVALAAFVSAQDYTGPKTGPSGQPYPSGVTAYPGVATTAFTNTAIPTVEYPSFASDPNATPATTTKATGNSTNTSTGSPQKNVGSSLGAGHVALLTIPVVAWVASRL